MDRDSQSTLQINKAKLDDVLMARDKARVAWLKDGDRNTIFFTLVEG